MSCEDFDQGEQIQRLIWTWLFTNSNLNGQALIIIVLCLTFMSVLTRAVNPGVVSSNPSSANILHDVWQWSLWQASFVFHQWPISLCGKAACCLEGMLMYWCEKAKKHMSRWTGSRTQSINQLTFMDFISGNQTLYNWHWIGFLFTYILVQIHKC